MPVFILLLIILAGGGLLADGQKIIPSRPGGEEVNDHHLSQTVFSINNWLYWVRNDGLLGRNPLTGRDGGFYPANNELQVNTVFAEGLIWGGFIRDGSSQQLRAGGANYSIGTVPGWIITPGDSLNDPIAVDPEDPRARVYRIRPDYATLLPADPAIRRDAALLNNVDINRVTDVMALAVIEQYRRDWQQWPVDLGAPFYDVNENGSYEPGLWIDGNGNGRRDLGEVEEPGLQMADQVIFFIINDTDAVATDGLLGSPPIGLEIQVTLWGFTAGATRKNALYKRYRIFNKSGFRIEDIYLGQWFDGDLGQFTDDLVACDSTLDSGFQFNGDPYDEAYQQYGLPPAAIAFTLLQGPAVASPGDTALVDFQPLPGFKNLEMTSFHYRPCFAFLGNDPFPNDYDRTLEWYNILRGYTPTTDLQYPTPYIAGDGPNRGMPTKFPVHGDPVSRSGDLDGRGINFPPCDRRSAVSCGPFTMENGQMQEVVWAVAGGLDPAGDEISSFAEVRRHVRRLRQGYGKSIIVPTVTAQVAYPDGRRSELTLRADLRAQQPAAAVAARLNDDIGGDPSLELNLFDDGAHDDSLAGDGIWGNRIMLDNRRYPHNVDLTVENGSGRQEYPKIVEQLRLRPLPELHNWQVAWENALQDRQLNNGERVHLTFSISNNDQVNAIDSARFTNLNTFIEISRLGTGNQVFQVSNPLMPGEIIGSGDRFWIVESAVAADTFLLRYRINFDRHSAINTDTIPLRPWLPGQLWHDTLAVIAEQGEGGNLTAIVSDPALLTGHTYQIDFSPFVDQYGDTLVNWSLIDSTAGQVLLIDQPVSIDPEYRHPVVDGIRYILRDPLRDPRFNVELFTNFQVIANGGGSIDPPEGAAADFRGFPSLRPTDRQQLGEGHWLIHTGDNGSRPSYAAFLDRISRAGDKWRQILPYDFEIRFTAGGSLASDWFQYGNVVQVPFELWNIGIATADDPSDDYRMVPVVIDFDLDGEFDFIDMADHSVSGGSDDPFSDWFYWYDPIDRSPGEGGYLAEAQQLMNDPSSWERSYAREVIARFVLVNWNGGETTTNGPYNQAMPEEGTIFRITTVKPNQPGDILRVRAPQGVPNEFPSPLSFELFQNFPNPFNPTTVIRYSLSVDRRVNLEIYDVLGRRVKTLVDDRRRGGTYRVLWDGRADGGYPVSAGLYFYRLTAGDFVKTRKMVLLR